MSLPSDLQAAISNLQSKHSGLVAAVRGYSGGSVATRTNTKLAEHRAGVKAMDVRTASLRRQIGQFEDTLLLDFVNSMYLSGGGGLDRAYKLQDLVSFSRASIGTYVGSSGLLRTAAANEPRIDYDPVTGECRGLLVEESRTNLVGNSGQINLWASGGPAGVAVLPSAAVAPDGTLAACSFTFNADYQYLLGPMITATAGTAYCASVFVKKGAGRFVLLISTADSTQTVKARINSVDGTITALGGAGGSTNLGVFKLPAGPDYDRYAVAGSFVTTLNGFSIMLVREASTDVGGTVWGAQLEAGAFPTSYIPTTDAQVTRAADIASVNELSPWFNPDEGVIVVEGLAASGSSAQHLAVFTDSSPINNALGLYRGSSGNLGSFIYTGGSAQHDTDDAPTIAGGALVKAALAYKAGDSARCHSGLTPVSVHAGVLPAVTSLRLGSRSDGAGAWNGHIRRLSYTPRRPTNAELQVLTA